MTQILKTIRYTSRTGVTQHEWRHIGNWGGLMSTRKKIRVGVIGAGSFAIASHLPNLARHDDVEFVGVARLGVPELQRLTAQYGFQVASEDYRDVLEAGVDVAVVSSPSALHFEHATAALEAGAHVLIEKPVTIDPEHAWSITATAERLDRAVVVSFPWNYTPLAQTAKSMLDKQDIGDLEQLSVSMSSVTRELLSNSGSYPGADETTAPDPATWTDPRLSGGGYAQAQLTHALGLALWTTGARATGAFAKMTAPLAAPVELHDAVVYEFEGGAIGTMSGGSGHLGFNDNRHAIQVRAIGSRGQFLIDLEREAAWLFRDGEEVRVPVTAGEGAHNGAPPLDTILAAARGEAHVNQSPAELGARVVEALDLAYRSATTGAWETRR